MHNTYSKALSIFLTCVPSVFSFTLHSKSIPQGGIPAYIFDLLLCPVYHSAYLLSFFFSRSLFLFVCILLLSYGCNIYYITLMRILIVPIYRLAVFCCSFNLVALDFLLFGEHGASCSWCWFFSNLQGLLIVHIFMW